jgi:hypothetical protein
LNIQALEKQSIEKYSEIIDRKAQLSKSYTAQQSMQSILRITQQSKAKHRKA